MEAMERFEDLAKCKKYEKKINWDDLSHGFIDSYRLNLP